MQNDPRKAGQLASEKDRFGEFGRYAVAAVHTRFDAVSWFVWDAEQPDEDGQPSIIRQEPTREDAVRGLLVPFVDVCQETAYGTTVRLPFQVRVF